MPARRSTLLRLLVGIVISAVFLAVTLSRVNLGQAAEAIGRAAPGTGLSRPGSFRPARSLRLSFGIVGRHARGRRPSSARGAGDRP